MTPADRFEDLFVRYWDGALTPPEAADFERLLRADAAALARFQHLCLQATVAADGPRVPGPVPAPQAFSRRRILAAAGLGAAGIVAGTFAAWRGNWGRPAVESAVRLTRVGGVVLVQAANVATGTVLRPGDTIRTDGIGSTAALEFPDGSRVQLTGDTTATLAPGPVPRLLIERGGVAADFPRTARRLSLETEDATASPVGESSLTLGRGPNRTDVGVHDGVVRMTRPGGAALFDLQNGEVGTIDADGASKNWITKPPDSYSWDLTRPPPPAWEAGTPDPDGPSLRAVRLHDPYAHNRHFQVRSVNAWTTGLMTLHPDSVMRVRYKLEKPATVMSMVVVRPAPLDGTHCAVMYDWKHAEKARPGEWQTVTAAVAELNQGPDGKRVPFGPPWTVTLAFVTTLDDDVGLKVAGFEIARPS